MHASRLTLNILKRNSVIVFGLAVLFYWTFSFLKHDAKLRTIIPFGDDPYDAVGSFAVIAANLLALVSLIRTFFPKLAGRSGAATYVLRSQSTVVFCVLLTVAANAVAMGRHVDMWMNAAGCGRLLIVLCILAIAALIVLLLLGSSSAQRTPVQVLRAAGVWMGTLLILWFYPKQLIAGTAGRLFTVVFGALLLFVPLATLVKAWLPSAASATSRGQTQKSEVRRYRFLAIAAATGFVVGGAAFLGEMTEGGTGLPLGRLFYVGSVYTGLGTAGLMIGYAFLGRLLGFVDDGGGVRG